MPIPMGLGRLGFSNTIFKQKNRFLFELRDICGGKSVSGDFVKAASLPNITIAENEIHHLNAVGYIPGKGTYEPLNVTYYNVGAEASFALLSWVNSVYQFSDPVNLRMGSSARDYGGTGILTLYDGCGGELERWTFRNMWPNNINFGDLDMEDGSILTVEMTLRYTSVQYQSFCGTGTLTSCCTPCGGNQTIR